VGLSVWDEGTTRKAMRDIVKDLIDSSGFPSEPRTYSAATLLEFLDGWKEAGGTLGDEFRSRLEREHPVWGREASYAISLFEASKKEANAMDFADLVWSVVCSANRDEVFSAALASRWLYVMVDEYQDTNDLQEQLVAHIARIHRNIMVVGDDDQSIYAFRGSKVEHILTFPDRWDGVKTIYLGQNYRSTPQIVSTAAASIGLNTHRMEKRLWSERMSGSMVSHLVCADQVAEASLVSRAILRSVSSGAPVGDHAILVRTRRQMHHFIAALGSVELPARAIGVVSWWEREDARLLFSWLRLVSNVRDIPSAAYVLARWPGIGAATVARWRELCGQRPGPALGPPLRSMISLKGYGRNTKRGASILHLVQAHEALVDAVERGAPVGEILSWMYGVCGIDADIAEGLSSKDSEESEIRAAHKSVAIDFAKRVGAVGADGITEFMDMVLVSSRPADDRSGVWISTIHAAKGLEFGKVWVCGCTDGLFPADVDPAELEEERRLFYVALTRAKDDLELCSPLRVMLSDGAWVNSRASRFIVEARSGGFVRQRDPSSS
jgi:DNA helicase-2/ATP-dependent DNA helicase PcrA